MDQHDLVYEEPAMQWTYGAPIGNGVIGAMVWGDGQPLHLTLDHPDFFDDRQAINDHPNNHYPELREMFRRGDRAGIIEASMMHMRRQGAKQKPPRKVAVGWADLTLPEGAKVTSMRLRLKDAVLSLRLTGGGELQMLAHAESPVLCIRAIGLAGAAAGLPLDLVSKGEPGCVPAGGVTGGVQWSRVSIGDGGSGVIAWLAAPDASGWYLTVNHDDKGDPVPAAASRLHAAAAAGWDALYERHAQCWAQFWSKSSVTIPDGRLESLWYIELYKLQSCSRRGMLPPNLQGLWPPHNEMPPWGGEHANNINTQMLYWPVYAANHMELLDPLHDWLIDDQLPAGRAYVKWFYGFEDGAYFHSSTIGRRCYRVGMYATCNLWQAVGAWWCQHLWWAHLYRPDPAFLRDRAYPFMRQCMLFYDSLLERDEAGVRHIPLTHSPEWQESEPQAFCSDSTIDLALVRYAARAAASAAQLLGLAEDARRWTEMAESLPPYPVDAATGLQIFPGQSLTESHRHHSHLAPLFPCGDISVDGDADQRSLINASLMQLERMGTGMWIGFSYPWAACLVARVGWGNYAWRMLDTYVGGLISPNTFNLNGDYKNQGVTTSHYQPFTNDAGSAAAEAINQMLLQSWGGMIRLFPAVPDLWREASFTDLRAEGGFVVSAELRGRTIVRVKILSEMGGPCRVLNTFGGAGVLESGGTLQVLDGPEFTFNTAPKGSYVLRPARAPEEDFPVTSPLAKEVNFFGIKRAGGLLATPIANDPLRGRRL